MERVLTALLTLASATLLLAAAPVRAADAKATGFLEQDQLVYGMDLQDAQQRVADEKNWEIAYRIDTPSTNDIACRYKQDVIYLAQFYQGRCYSLEKRAMVTKDEALRIFEHYTELLGPTAEITNSRDESLLFGRWALKDREIELTAYEHHDGQYLAIYTEFDPLAKGEALYARDNEMASQPMTIDPITGQPVPIKQGDAAADGGAEAGQAGEGQGEQSQAGEGQGEDGKQDPPPPPPDDDWLGG